MRARHLLAALTTMTMTVLGLGGCGDSGGGQVVVSEPVGSDSTTTTTERSTTSAPSTTTTPAATTTTEPSTPADEASEFVPGPAFSASATFDVTDALGYRWTGTVGFAFASPVVDIEDSAPGEAKVQVDFAVVVKLTNQTPGRNAIVYWAAAPLLDATAGLADDYWRCEAAILDGADAFPVPACAIDGLGLAQSDTEGVELRSGPPGETSSLSGTLSTASMAESVAQATVAQFNVDQPTLPGFALDLKTRTPGTAGTSTSGIFVNRDGAVTQWCDHTRKCTRP